MIISSSRRIPASSSQPTSFIPPHRSITDADAFYAPPAFTTSPMYTKHNAAFVRIWSDGHYFSYLHMTSTPCLSATRSLPQIPPQLGCSKTRILLRHSSSIPHSWMTGPATPGYLDTTTHIYSQPTWAPGHAFTRPPPLFNRVRRPFSDTIYKWA